MEDQSHVTQLGINIFYNLTECIYAIIIMKYQYDIELDMGVSFQSNYPYIN